MSGLERSSPVGARVPPSPARALEALGSRLLEAGAEVELCLVGGAVVPVVFASPPSSRRPSVMLRPVEALRRAEAAMAQSAGLPERWVEGAVRDLLGGPDGSPPAWEAPGVRAFEARAEYVLPFRCLRLVCEDAEERREVEADVRYLTRLLGLDDIASLLTAVTRYVPPRQLPAGLEARLVALLP